MTLASGTRFGSYELTAPLGAGGIGEVYRARDTGFKRNVAITVLPAALANDEERLAQGAPPIDDVGFGSGNEGEVLAPQLHFIVNWLEELKRLVPTE